MHEAGLSAFGTHGRIAAMTRPPGRRMGLTHVPVRLRAVNGAGKTLECDFLVDTGATDCLAPAAALRRIDVRPVGRMSYEHADGTVHEYEFGLVQIQFMGELTAGRVIFGPDDAEPLLGVTALESAGFTVDPASQTLKRLPAIPLKPLPVRRGRTGEARGGASLL
jgi:clan AA aspartic protease